MLAPVKNENLEVILFVLNFDELNESLDNKSKRFSKRNRLLQQIGMPFISSIFARTPSPNKETATPQINDPFAFLNKRKKSSFVREHLSRNNSKTSTLNLQLNLFEVFIYFNTNFSDIEVFEAIQENLTTDDLDKFNEARINIDNDDRKSMNNSKIYLRK